MKEEYLLVLLLSHFLADFVCQTDWQAKNKSTNLEALTSHTSIYSFVVGILAWIFIDKFTFLHQILFVSITFCIHTLQDNITSKIVKRYFDKQNYHNGFVTIGFDQVLHYIQLYFTLKLVLSI